VIERLRAILDDVSTGNGRLAPLGEFLSICRGEEIGKESPRLVEMAGQSSAPQPGRPQGSRLPPLPYDGEKPFVYGRGDPCGRPTDNHPAGDGLTVGGHWAYPILRGGIDIHTYSIPRGHWRIARDAIVKPLERYLSPKLLVVKSTDRLQATLDLHGHVALQTLYLLHLRDKSSNEDSLYFFLALLNSRLLREYVYVLHTAYKWVQPQIEQRVLANLPVPLSEPAQQRPIIEQARQLMNACSRSGAVVEWNAEITSMYEELERNIRALYAFALMEGM